MGQTTVLRTVFFCCLVAVVRPSTAEVPRLAAAEVAFTEGLLAFDAGRNEEAAERLAEAARLNPAEGGARYFLGLALLRLGQAREAAEEIAASFQARLPPEVDRERVLADLAAARKAAEGSPAAVEPPEWQPAPRAIDDRGLWEGTAGLSLALDSNPNLLSEDLGLQSPAGEVIRGEEGDEAAVLGARFGFYPFHAREARVSAGFTLEAGQSLHLDFGVLDLGLARGTVQAAIGGDPLGFLEGPLGAVRVPFAGSRVTALFQAGGSSYQLDGSSYLSAWEGAASLTFNETPGTATRLDLLYSDLDFSDADLADERRSGEELSVRASQLFFLGRRDRFLRLGVLAGDREAGRPFSASIEEGSVELRWPLAVRWAAHAEGTIRRAEYDGSASNLFDPKGKAREDTTTRAAVTLSWAARDRLRWTARGVYLDRDSNLGFEETFLDYRRTAVSIGLSWRIR
jgi:hypothetical protein